MVAKRKTSKKSFSRAKRTLNAWLRQARHLPIGVQARLLGAKLRGHFQYYGIRGNSDGLSRFSHEASRLWHKWLSRRSQRGYVDWDTFCRIRRRYPLPPPRLPPTVKQLRLANL
jgi:RNA-directed DNA polymerase